MTCVVGMASGGVVYMAADSAGVGGWELTIRRDPKVFVIQGSGDGDDEHSRGSFVIGFTTSFRMGQLLRFGFNPPRRRLDHDVFDYMVTVFVEAVRERLKAGGFATKKDDVETAGTFLVGVDGRLFTIDGDYQVGESNDGVMACGCGAPYALGAMFASLPHVAPRDKLWTALRAAENYSAGVRGPFVVEQAGQAAAFIPVRVP